MYIFRLSFIFQKYVSDSKNLKGIYEYDRGVQGSENLLFYKEIKKRSHMTS